VPTDHQWVKNSAKVMAKYQHIFRNSSQRRKKIYFRNKCREKWPNVLLEQEKWAKKKGYKSLMNSSKRKRTWRAKS